MAHFVELDKDNKVLRVIVVGNENCNDLPFPESEAVGVAFLERLFGTGKIWKQTSYNGNFRKRYCGKGDAYDAVNDAFIAPQPYASWSLDASFDWQAPIERPVLLDNEMCIWNESELKWDVITRPV